MADLRKVIIATITSNDKFYNIKDNAGTEYGISREKSPKLATQLANAKTGDEITAEYFLWKEKHYLSDAKESGKGGKGNYTPADKPFQAAISAATAASNVLFGKGFSQAAFDDAFNHIYNKISEKITK